MSDSLQPHGRQHTRLPCPSLSPGVCSSSCPLSQWYYLTISSFVIPFSSCPQSFPAPGSFPRSQLFTSGGQHIGTSASASVLPVNVQGWFLLGLTGLISSSYLLEKAMATHSSTLAWKIPWAEEPGRLQSMGSLRVGHNWATSLSLFTFMHWRRKWQPTPVFLPGESQGRRSLVGCCLWVAQSRTQLKWLSSSSSSSYLLFMKEQINFLKKQFYNAVV